MCKHDRRSNIDSRKHDDYTRRRYLCRDCGEKFSTVEVIVDMNRTQPALKSLRQQWGNTITAKDINHAIIHLQNLRDGIVLEDPEYVGKQPSRIEADKILLGAETHSYTDHGYTIPEESIPKGVL